MGRSAGGVHAAPGREAVCRLPGTLSFRSTAEPGAQAEAEAPPTAVGRVQPARHQLPERADVVHGIPPAIQNAPESRSLRSGAWRRGYDERIKTRGSPLIGR